MFLAILRLTDGFLQSDGKSVFDGGIVGFLLQTSPSLVNSKAYMLENTLPHQHTLSFLILVLFLGLGRIALVYSPLNP